MKVQLVDPSAFTPPYDHALAAALARAGAEVELVTSRFLYGPVPPAEGYRVERALLPAQRPRAASMPAARLPFKAAEHLPDMLRLRRARRRRRRPLPVADVPALDALLLPPRAPAGDDRPLHPAAAAEPPPGRARARRAFGAMDAVVAHSEHGAARLRDEVGLDPARVRVIPHGAFDYLTRLPEEKPLPAELRGAEGPVILFFGLLRPYKGIEILLEAFRRGRGRRALDRRQPADGRRAAAPSSPREAAGPRPLRHPLRRRRRDPGDLPPRRPRRPALPRRRALRRPLHRRSPSASRWSSAPSAASPRWPRPAPPGSSPPGDAAALAGALAELVARRGRPRRARRGRRRAAAGPFSWDEVARLTLALYRELLEARRDHASPQSSSGSRRPDRLHPRRLPAGRCWLLHGLLGARRPIGLRRRAPGRRRSDAGAAHASP